MIFLMQFNKEYKDVSIFFQITKEEWTSQLVAHTILYHEKRAIGPSTVVHHSYEH